MGLKQEEQGGVEERAKTVEPRFSDAGTTLTAKMRAYGCSADTLSEFLGIRVQDLHAHMAGFRRPSTIIQASIDVVLDMPACEWMNLSESVYIQNIVDKLERFENETCGEANSVCYSEGMAINTHVKTIYQLAIEAHLSHADRPAPEKDEHFSTWLRSIEQVQTYRYLRKWLRETFGENFTATHEQLLHSLQEKQVMSELRGKSLDDLTDIAITAQGAARDLINALAAWKEVAGDEEGGNSGDRLQVSNVGPPNRTGPSGKGQTAIGKDQRTDGSRGEESGTSSRRVQTEKGSGSSLKDAEVNRG